MPGITGLINQKPKEANEKTLAKMVDAMSTEDFYTSGTYLNEGLGLYVGWVSHKGSFSDCMPVFNEARDLLLIFTGENFIDESEIGRLKHLGHVFGETDASYLIHLYEEDPDGFLERLNGWFSGVLVDLKNSVVSVFNDRYGMSRVYYHLDKDGFLFSSEAKSLLKVDGSLRRIDPRSLGQLFSYGCTLEDNTLFTGILLMPGGSDWRFAKGRNKEKKQYFRPGTWENQPVLDKNAFYREINRCFSSILPRYLDSGRPVSLSVTGGLDSRMILSCIGGKRVPCFTFGGLYRDCYDVKIARKVAYAAGQSHSVIRLNDGFLKNFSTYAEKTVYATDGTHGVSGAHDIFLNSLARDIAPVRLSGVFGGEVMRSIAALKAHPPAAELFSPDFVEHTRSQAVLEAEPSRQHALSRSVFTGIPKGMYGCFLAERSQVTLRSPFMDNALVGLMYQAPPELLFTNEVSLRIIAENSPGLDAIFTDRGYSGRHIFLLSRLYEKFLWTMFKLDWYYGVGMPGYVSMLEPIPGLRCMRKAFLGTQRIDHYRMWIQNELAGYVRDVLLDERTKQRPYLNGKNLEPMVTKHMKGLKNHTTEITRTLTVELIHRLLLED